MPIDVVAARIAQQEARKVAEPIAHAAMDEFLGGAPETVKAAAVAWLEQHPPAPGRDGADGRDGEEGPEGKPGTDGMAGKAGDPGRDGRSFIWRGTYSTHQSYTVDDVVAYEGSSFICVQDTRNKPPGVGWDLMAKKGDPGRDSTSIVRGSGGSGSGGGGAITVSDEGVALDAAVTSIDFAGIGVTATNVGHAVTVTIEQTVYVQASDPGAVGAGKLWVDTTTPGPPWVILIRNGTDDGWDDYAGSLSFPAPPLADVLGAGHDANAGLITNIDRFQGVLGGVGWAPAEFRINGGAILYAGDDDDGNEGGRIALTAGASGIDGIVSVTTGSQTFAILAGTDDPSSGAGIAASIRSEYRRDNAGVGELWFKVGSGDTDWSQVI